MSKPNSPSLHSIVALVFVIGSLFHAGNSSAYTLINLNTLKNTGIDYNTNASVNTSVDVDANLDTGSNNATSSPATNAGLDAGADAGLTGSATGTVNGASDSDINMSSDMLGVGQVMTVGRVQADAAGEDESIVVISPRAVETNADLEAYALGAVRSDALVDEINFTDKTVEMKYKEEGRLLALIPITFTVRVMAHADGSVEVKYPWYAAMTVDKQGEIEAQAKVAVDNTLRARTVGSVRGEGVVEERFTAAEAADVAAQIHAVLKAELGVDNTGE